MDLHAIITDEIRAVAKEQGKALKPLNDDTALSECGLDSLGFAILVANLEDKLGYDPFATAEDVRYPQTIGDLVQFYGAGVPA